jgi:hypothetical protein
MHARHAHTCVNTLHACATAQNRAIAETFSRVLDVSHILRAVSECLIETRHRTTNNTNNLNTGPGQRDSRRCGGDSSGQRHRPRSPHEPSQDTASCSTQASRRVRGLCQLLRPARVAREQPGRRCCRVGDWQSAASNCTAADFEPVRRHLNAAFDVLFCAVCFSRCPFS